VMEAGVPQWLAMKRLIPAERRPPRLIDRERRNTDAMQGVSPRWEQT
jgi:hypothetical protein